ncbi:MAG: ATP-binding protein, partial [Acidimicrobiia bacterium]|nr:ATP-binding protein [Acidimicrobiia bacterium]
MTVGPSSPINEPKAAFLGRQDEFAVLDTALSNAVRDGAQVLVVGGEAGIGKSTLLKMFAARSDATARHVTVRCSPYDFDGVQPILRLTAGLGPDAPPPAVITDPVPADPEQARAQRTELFSTLVTGLLDRIGSAPTLAVIDDVHWGRAPLHELLAFFVEELIARRLQHRLLLVLVTRLLPPPHPVAALLTDFERHLDLPRLQLGPLTPE